MLPPVDEYEVEWPDSHTETEKEQAEVNKVKVETLAAYVNAMGADMVMPPEMFLERYMSFTPEEVGEAMLNVEKLFKDDRQGGDDDDSQL